MIFLSRESVTMCTSELLLVDGAHLSHGFKRAVVFFVLAIVLLLLAIGLTIIKVLWKRSKKLDVTITYPKKKLGYYKLAQLDDFSRELLAHTDQNLTYYRPLYDSSRPSMRYGRNSHNNLNRNQAANPAESNFQQAYNNYQRAYNRACTIRTELDHRPRVCDNLSLPSEQLLALIDEETNMLIELITLLQNSRDQLIAVLPPQQ